jgi:hypothetical protein
MVRCLAVTEVRLVSCRLGLEVLLWVEEFAWIREIKFVICQVEMSGSGLAAHG